MKKSFLRLSAKTISEDTEVKDIFTFFEGHDIHPIKGTVFEFKDIRKARTATDHGSVNEKVCSKLPVHAAKEV